MNKKLKKMLATVSSVAMCAVSVISTNVSAIPLDENGKYPNQYTTSFIVHLSSLGGKSVKCTFWQEGTDYYGDPEHFRVFLSEPVTYVDTDTGEEVTRYFTMFVHTYMIGDGNGGKMPFSDTHSGNSATALAAFSADKGGVNEDKLPLVEEYLKNNSIKYTKSSYDFTEVSGESIEFDYTGMSLNEMAELATKIREYAGWSFEDMQLPADTVNITDVVNELFEPTLLGDTDCDGKVNINDAVFVMQSIANPDKYQLSEQGKANADIDGNGITLSDAVTIQEMAASHLYD